VVQARSGEVEWGEVRRVIHMIDITFFIR